jgi:hypothetical protein
MSGYFEFEKKVGAFTADGMPSLQTLCVRELHTALYEFAKGELYPAVIQYKAMMAARNNEEG